MSELAHMLDFPPPSGTFRLCEFGHSGVLIVLYLCSVLNLVQITSCTLVQHQHRVNGDHAFLWETAKFNPSQNQNTLADWYEILDI